MVASASFDLKTRQKEAVARGLSSRNADAVHAENAELWDADRKRFIDFAAGITATNTGLRNPKIMAAVSELAQALTPYSPSSRSLRVLHQTGGAPERPDARRFRQGNDAGHDGRGSGRKCCEIRACLHRLFGGDRRRIPSCSDADGHGAHRQGFAHKTSLGTMPPDVFRLLPPLTTPIEQVHDALIPANESRMSSCRFLSSALFLSLGWIFLPFSPALADCIPPVASGATVTCTGTNGTVGNGSGTTNSQNNVTVNVGDGATIDGGTGYGIILHDNASINVGTGGGATALVTNAGGKGSAVDEAGFNTIQFNSNSTITIQTNGEVTQTGSTTRTEAINPTGISNTITNYGLIQNSQGPAIWFQDITTNPNTFNTIDNYGRIKTTLTGPDGGLTSVIGATDKGLGNGAVHFINESTGYVGGNIQFVGGNDLMTLYTGSTITGSIDGGAGTNTMILRGTGTDELNGAISNFSSLQKLDSGTWTLLGNLANNSSNPNASLAVDVNQGTLILTGNNPNFNGTMTVDPAGTLQLGNGGSSGNINSSILDNGTVVFNRSDDVTFANVISGSGIVQQSGTGITTLTGVNSYSGGTIINSGTLAVGADSALGNAAGPLTFNGGTFQFNQSFDLASSRAITILAPGGTIDTQGYDSTIAQGITGAGALAKTGSGALTLDGNNSYLGGTTIAQGTLVVGDAVHTSAALSGGGPVTVNGSSTLTGYGSATGNVTNNGTIGVANALAEFNASPGGNFIINGNLTNNNTIAIGGGENAPGNQLIVNGNYVGNNGTIALNTYLGSDGSPSDKLVISNGVGSGITSLHITNVGGPGAETRADGILVVSAINGATTTADAFSLAGEVRGGAFDYALEKGGANGNNPQSWFLRSDFTIGPGPIVPPSPDLPVDPPSTGNLPPATYPIIGPEIATYSVVQPIARQLGLTTLGTLNDRRGDTNPCIVDFESRRREEIAESTGGNGVPKKRLDDCTDDERPTFWARAFGQQIDNHYESFASPSTSGQILGLQAGVDIWHSPSYFNHRDAGGFYFGYSDTNVDVTGLVAHATAWNSGFYSSQHTGFLNLDAISGGAYWTHYGPGGWYVDAVAQITRYGGSVSTQYAGLDTTGYGLLGSLEGGYPIAIPLLGPGFVLEPQTQVVWQRVQFDSANDGLGDVALGTTDGVSGRFGARGSWTIQTAEGQEWKPYLSANIWRDWGARADTVYSGIDNVPLLQQAYRLQLGGGLNVKVNSNLNFHVNVDYQFAVGDTDGGTRNGVGGAAGLRYTW